MRKFLKFPDKVIMIDYNVSTRRTKFSVYAKERPLLVDVCIFYAEEPLDMFFQSDKDLLSDIIYYLSFSAVRVIELKRPAFFGKKGEYLKRYYNLR